MAFSGKYVTSTGNITSNVSEIIRDFFQFNLSVDIKWINQSYGIDLLIFDVDKSIVENKVRSRILELTSKLNQTYGINLTMNDFSINNNLLVINFEGLSVPVNL